MARRMLPLALAAALLLALPGDAGRAAPAFAPLGTAFTYQGELDQNGAPLTGACDFQFGLFADPAGGPALGSQSLGNVAVTGGRFTVPLDFGAPAFAGEARFLEIAVRCPAGGGGFTTLTPRQPLTATPYALFARDTRALQGIPVSPTDPTLNQVLQFNGTQWAPASLAGGPVAAWLLAGNAATDPNTQFLGTTDNQTLTLRVNNVVGWRLQPSVGCLASPCTPNVIGGFGGNMVGAGIEGATIGGGGDVGIPNGATGSFATVGGGQQNAAGGLATVGGGVNNVAGGSGATVGGGGGNRADGNFASVPGGSINSAQSAFSFAAGRNAKAIHQGAFVWADSSDVDFISDSALVGDPFNDDIQQNAFHVRATGGARFVSKIDFLGVPQNGVELTPGSGAWATPSRRELKENFAPVDPRAVLATLAAVPLESWNYIAEGTAVRHIGPMAHDFWAAFGLGAGDGAISTLDVDGVVLAAIQGLYQVLQEQADTISAQQVELAGQSEQLTAQQARVAHLEREVAALRDAAMGREAQEARLAALEQRIVGAAR